MLNIMYLELVENKITTELTPKSEAKDPAPFSSKIILILCN
jgi:hypothetical protein